MGRSECAAAGIVLSGSNIRQHKRTLFALRALAVSNKREPALSIATFALEVLALFHICRVNSFSMIDMIQKGDEV
jgi:hypothetical protein